MLSVLISTLLAGALASPLQTRQSLWQPTVGEKWQIVISQPVDTTTTIIPSDATVYDVDLFYSSKEDIASMKAQGKKVICYYSAGSAENWRPDYKEFAQSDMGEGLVGWEGENWLNIRSEAVLNVMKERIKMASDKGCDAIDPDNMGKHLTQVFTLSLSIKPYKRIPTYFSIDGYSNGGGGFSLTQQDSIQYLQNQAAAAASYGMSTGLKNAQEILPQVLDIVQFAVNEECAADEGQTACTEYNSLLAAGKPVFHIEYLDEQNNESNAKAQDSVVDKYCLMSTIGSQLSTVIKYLALDGFVEYCDGTQETTAVNKNYNTGDPGDHKGGDSHN
jgi:endo-alpha-1,4-polygalactosaminidase (GH114 family)